MHPAAILYTLSSACPLIFVASAPNLELLVVSVMNAERSVSVKDLQRNYADAAVLL